MIRHLYSLSSLLLGTALLLTGTGLFGTLLAVRGGLEGFAPNVLGLVMSAYFVGYLLGTYINPRIIHRVGHVRAFAIRSEEHTSELQSLMRSSYAVFCLKKKNKNH